MDHAILAQGHEAGIAAAAEIGEVESIPTGAASAGQSGGEAAALTGSHCTVRLGHSSACVMTRSACTGSKLASQPSGPPCERNICQAPCATAGGGSGRGEAAAGCQRGSPYRNGVFFFHTLYSSFTSLHNSNQGAQPALQGSGHDGGSPLAACSQPGCSPLLHLIRVFLVVHRRRHGAGPASNATMNPRSRLQRHTWEAAHTADAGTGLGRCDGLNHNRGIESQACTALYRWRLFVSSTAPHLVF